LKIEPDIAEKWSVSRDGLLYSFHLRKGVRFSNGREVRAEDFKYSFERVLKKETVSPNTWVLDRISGAREFMDGKSGRIKGIIVKGPYELELKLGKPFGPFPGLLAMTAAYVVPREQVEKYKEEFSAHPAGTGPFALQKWEPAREVVLAAREDYFEGRPKVKGLVYRVIPEDLTTVVEFELGNLDVISIPASVYKRFSTDKKWSKYIASANGLNTYYLGLNCSKAPFNDKELRRAVSLSIDKQKILATYFESRGTLASGPVPPGLRDWVPQKIYDFDPQKAKAILKERGYSESHPLKVDFLVTSQDEVADMAEIIQGYLAKVGIQAQLRQLEWNAYKEAINKGEPDLFWLSWWADYPDPENFLYPLFHSDNLGPAGNRTRYVNPETDRLIQEGQGSVSIAQRDKFYQMAEENIVRDSPWVFFWHRKEITLRQPRVKNYNIYPVYSMDKGMEVGLF
jgi:ABC-type transport system substrate-binding protein